MWFYSMSSVAILCVFALTSCNEDNLIPIDHTSYDSGEFINHIEPVQKYYDAFEGLLTLMEDSKSGNLDAPLFTERMNVIKSRVVGGYQPILNQLSEDFIRYSSAGQAEPGLGKGGYLDGILINESGQELAASIENGLLGAFMYYQAAKLLRPEMSLKDLDQVRAFYGDFCRPENASDFRFMAASVKKLDQIYSTSYSEEISAALLNIQNDLFNGFLAAEEDIANLKFMWEKAHMNRLVHQVLTMKKKLSNLNASPLAKSEFLLDYSIGSGMLIGWRSILSTNKVLNDFDHKYLMNLLLMTERTADPLRMLEYPDLGVNNLNKCIDKLAEVYQFPQESLTL